MQPVGSRGLASRGLRASPSWFACLPCSSLLCTRPLTTSPEGAVISCMEVALDVGWTGGGGGPGLTVGGLSRMPGSAKWGPMVM